MWKQYESAQEADLAVLAEFIDLFSSKYGFQPVCQTAKDIAAPLAAPIGGSRVTPVVVPTTFVTSSGTAALPHQVATFSVAATAIPVATAPPALLPSSTAASPASGSNPALPAVLSEAFFRDRMQRLLVVAQPPITAMDATTASAAPAAAAGVGGVASSPSPPPSPSVASSLHLPTVAAQRPLWVAMHELCGHAPRVVLGIKRDFRRELMKMEKSLVLCFDQMIDPIGLCARQQSGLLPVMPSAATTAATPATPPPAAAAADPSPGTGHRRQQSVDIVAASTGVDPHGIGAVLMMTLMLEVSRFLPNSIMLQGTNFSVFLIKLIKIIVSRYESLRVRFSGHTDAATTQWRVAMAAYLEMWLMSCIRVCINLIDPWSRWRALPSPTRNTEPESESARARGPHGNSDSGMAAVVLSAGPINDKLGSLVFSDASSALGMAAFSMVPPCLAEAAADTARTLTENGLIDILSGTMLFFFFFVSFFLTSSVCSSATPFPTLFAHHTVSIPSFFP